MPRLLFIVAESGYFISHRLSLALEAQKQGYTVAVATSSTKNFNHDKSLLENHGIRVFGTPFSRTSLNPLKDLPTLIELYRAYKAFKPDIIHNVALKPVLYGSFIAKMCCVSQIVNAVAGLGYVFISDNPKAKLLRWILRPLLQYALKNTHIIVQNQDDQHTIASWLQQKAKTRIHLILGAGVNIDVFSPAQKLAYNQTITLIARMLWSKGIREVIEVARLLKQSHPQAIIQLVGAPDIQNPDHVPKHLLKKWHEEGLIRWLGARKDIADIYRNSQIALLPSYREGLPKSLLEAMACGLPLVTTDAPGCKELIDGNGILVPVKDSKAVYVALITLLEDNSLCQKMGARSRERALSTYSEEIIHRRSLSVYT